MQLDLLAELLLQRRAEIDTKTLQGIPPLLKYPILNYTAFFKWEGRATGPTEGQVEASEDTVRL